ncbi:MAG TPA: hypothetical protein VM287_00755 [Egibacteraceae bacterium]|nr:hypothetical protein [Egibacteraceae bacterium]
MATDMEERLRRSLATRVRDVEPDPAMWETVQTRIHRRAHARWSATGAVAALVLAALVLPDLFAGTRVDLAPADPPAGGVPLSAPGLVTTDGRTFTVSDARGDWVRELDPPTENSEPLPITRLAVRPGSTADDLAMVFVRADDACERVEIAWTRERQPDPAKDLESISLAGTLGGGQGYCATDPVWSPDGRTVAWVEQDGDTFTLQTRAWTDEGPAGDSATESTRHELDTPDLTGLRATGWWGEESADGGTEGVIALSGRRADGTVQAFTVPFTQDAGELQLSAKLEPAEPHLDGAVRSAMLVPQEDGSGLAGGYDLGVDRDGTVVLSRLADNAEPARLPLDPDVLTAEDIDGGAAWLSARGDTVVFGVAGDSWIVRWRDEADEPSRGEPQQLPGTVVHAAPVADGRPAGERAHEPALEPTAPSEPGPAAPQPTSVDLSSVVTDGEAITLNRPEGPIRLVTAVEGDIIDFALHPASTPDDVTVVWRQGRGCDATLHHRRVAGDAETPARELSATCPGRPAFAPDGTHLAWMSQPDFSSGETLTEQPGLETLAWTDGPADSLVTFGVQAEQPETVAFDVADWVWTEGHGTPTAGTLHFVGYNTHGTPSAHTLPVERQGDGALALPAGATAQERPAIIEVDSHLNDGAAVGPSYDLGSVPGADPNTLRVTRAVDGGDQPDEFSLPDGLLTVYGGAVETDNVWMTARGRDVLLGDGNGAAWRLSWTGEAWSDLVELEGVITYAVPFSG